MFQAVECGVAGYYTFELNGVPAFSMPTKNLITDFGWNRLFNMGEQNNNLTVVQVGTGNTTPSTADTSLVAFLAQVAGNSTGTVQKGTDTIGEYTSTRVTYVFAQGAVVGNISEVGWKVANGDSALTSRSLIKDGLGNPATMTVTAIDQLTVTYELRYYRPPVSNSGTLTIGGVSTNYTLLNAVGAIGTTEATYAIAGFKPSRVTMTHYGTGHTFGVAGVNPSGGGAISAASAELLTSVVVDTVASTVTVSTNTIATGTGNSPGGVGAVLIEMHFGTGGPHESGMLSAMKLSFTPFIAKDNTKTLRYTLVYTITRL